LNLIRRMRNCAHADVALARNENLVHIPEIDDTDPSDLRIGEIRGRREAIFAMEALRKFMPGCEGA
jgi:hypothetical protein